MRSDIDTDIFGSRVAPRTDRARGALFGTPLRRVALVVAASTAAVHGLAYHSLFADFNGDEIVQVSAAQSLADGQGLTVPSHAATDPAAISRTPLIGWPPGYSLAMTALIRLVPDYWWAMVTLNSVLFLLFLGSWAVILNELAVEVQSPAALTIWAFWAIAQVPTAGLGSSDLLALAAYSWAIAVTLLSLRSRAVLALRAVSGCLLGLAVFTRYAYWPMAGVLPLVGWLSDRSRAGRWRGLALSGGIPAAVILVVVLHYQSVTGHATYLDAWYPDTGWFWSNWLRLHPFPMSCLGIDQFVVDAIVKLGLPPRVLDLLWVPSLPLLVAFLGRAKAHVDPRVRSEVSPCASAFYRTAAGTLVATIGMLAYLSLRHAAVPAHWTVDGTWTYVADRRYFAPVWPFLFVSVISVVWGIPSLGPRLLRRSVVAILIVSAALSAGRTAWHWLTYPGRAPAWRTEAGREERSTILEVVRTRTPRETVVYCDARPDHREIARMAGAHVLASPSQILAPKGPWPAVTFIVAAPDREPWATWVRANCARSQCRRLRSHRTDLMELRFSSAG